MSLLKLASGPRDAVRSGIRIWQQEDGRVKPNGVLFQLSILTSPYVYVLQESSCVLNYCVRKFRSKTVMRLDRSCNCSTDFMERKNISSKLKPRYRHVLAIHR